MSLQIFNDLEQGSPEWFEARCGIVTASVVNQLVSSRQPTAIETDCPECDAPAISPCIGKRSPGPLKTLHPARAAAARELPRKITADTDSDTARTLTNTLTAERITRYVEPTFTSVDMERGNLSEPIARAIYSERYAPATTLGFMALEQDGYRLGFSPDGLVGDDGLLEIKAPRQKKHLATILDDAVPLEHMAQIQTGLMVSGRAWLDFISYCGGMRLFVKRVFPDEQWFEAIRYATRAVEDNASAMIARYHELTKDSPDTERIDFFPELELNF